ncbi:hypothetical protein PC112_g20864 [Phytophthora cactorum]|nr:hypothetical protein PC112_g20864 [Phytophthora cactorum]
MDLGVSLQLMTTAVEVLNEAHELANLLVSSKLMEIDALLTTEDNNCDAETEVSGVVFSIVLCPVMIGFAAMIFSHPDFSETLPMLTKLVFASSTMHQLVITSLSPGTRLSPDYGPRAQAVVALERQRPPVG